MIRAMNKLHSRVYETLEAKFGLINDAMTRRGAASHIQFFNTSEPRVKVCLQHDFNKTGDATSISVMVAVEEADRPGTFFALGDRLHFDVEKFPEFKFHQELAAKLSKTAARTDFMSGDVLSFAQELVEKL